MMNKVVEEIDVAPAFVTNLNTFPGIGEERTATMQSDQHFTCIIF